MKILKKLNRNSVKLGSKLKRLIVRKFRFAIKHSKVSRLVRKYARMEARIAIAKFLNFVRVQISIRPRLKLSFKVLILLALFLVASVRVSDILAQKKDEIKVHGQAVLVAKEKSPGDVESEITFETSSKLSPFAIVNPVDNSIITQGYSAHHRAVDLATALGSPIKPIGLGVVEFVGYSKDGKGNIVIVNHGDGLKTLYAHMGKISVSAGENVDTSSTLGEVGLTGRTTGAHLHIEVYDGNVAMDPSSVLP